MAEIIDEIIEPHVNCYGLSKIKLANSCPEFEVCSETWVVDICHYPGFSSAHLLSSELRLTITHYVSNYSLTKTSALMEIGAMARGSLLAI